MKILIALLLAAPAFAQEAPIGSMEVMRTSLPRPDREKEARTRLDLANLDVSVTLHGDVAETRVEHDFYNDSDERLEGTFRFPLPIGADVTGLAMEIDGRMVDGELIERSRAEKIYDEIVDEMRDPAILTWDSGNLFKLRVFPIEPNAHKKVVIRYLTNLEQNRYVFAAEAAQLSSTIRHFHFALDGKTLFNEDRFTPRVIAFDVPAVHQTLREVKGEKSYLRVELPLQVSAKARPRTPSRWAIVIDTSRSALESKTLMLDSLRAAMATLVSGDEFMILACDIECHESEFAPSTPANAAKAVNFIESIEFDGATDLALALKKAAARAPNVLYIGDGNATWGATDVAELSKLLEPIFQKVTLHAVVLGKFARPALLTQLSNFGGGLIATPSRRADLDSFARSLASFGRVARVHDIQLSVKDGEISPKNPASIDAGQPLTAFVKGDAKSVHLQARVNDQVIDREIAIGSAKDEKFVARRFAGAKIRELELEGGHDDDVLNLSLEHQVLSSKTAWLVLENDEAYRKHEIERKNKQSSDPTVTGKDLEGGENAVGGEGPEPELCLMVAAAGLMMMLGFAFRRRWA